MSSSEPRNSPPAPDSAIVAVVLAAGMSRRMGTPKMLLPFGGLPLLARVLEGLSAGGVEKCLVVTGHRREEVERIVDGFAGARAVHNARYADGGMLSSVQAGVAELPADAEGFMVVLGDQPLVRPETLCALLGAWRESGAPVTAPSFGGRRGHPVLFAACCASEILGLPEGATLRDVVQRHTNELCDVEARDPAIHIDIDTPDDYERALCEWNARRGPSDPPPEVTHA